MMKPIYFVHIPKTAGTSFRVASVKYYGKRSIVRDYGESAKETSDIVRKYAYRNRDYWKLFEHMEGEGSAMLGGHVSILKYVTGLGVANTVVFFRDPLQRMYSEYKHLVRHRGFKESFKDLYTRTPYINVLSRKLEGVPVEAVGLLGLTESYRESLALFNRCFDAELEELEENKGKKHVDDTHEIDPEDVVEFLKLNGKDVELYRYIQRLFAQRLELFRCERPYVHGKLVSVTQKKVSGWAWWEGGDDSPVEIDVRINGNVVGRAASTELRPSLLRAAPPRGGYVGFSFPVEVSAGDEIDCVVAKTGQSFPPDKHVFA